MGERPSWIVITVQWTLRDVSVQNARRVRLPADHSSPGLARSAVRAAVAEAGLDAVLDEALLLTTELTTNSVIHARTDFEIQIDTDADGVTVTVTDTGSGPLASVPNDRVIGGELDERGRGLLLVDRLASRWGTLYSRDGRGVWFRLDAVTGTGMDTPPPAVSASHAIALPSPEALGALTAVRRREGATLEEVAAELLARFREVSGVAGVAVVVDEGDGADARTLAANGVAVTGTDRDLLSVSLPLSRPWRGELLVVTEHAGGYQLPLAQLVADRLALLVENERLRRTDSERRTWLTFLAEVSELLAQSLDVDLTLALIPRLVVPRLGQWCAVHAADDDGNLRLAAAAHADEAELAQVLDALGQAVPQLQEAMAVDTAVPFAAPVEGYAVALLARGQRLGTVTVGRALGTWQHTEEVAVLEDVARRAALAIDNALIHRERRTVAQALQRSLLPPQLPKVDGVEFGAEYVPTGETVDVGGDFYDVLALSDRRWLVVVGDVSGKGVQAATVTGLVRDVTRVLVRDGRPLTDALIRLNETLVERGGGRFCTLCLAAITRRDDGRVDVTLHLAGHDQPVLVHADGTTALVGSCGTALGLLDSIKSPHVKLALEPGDTLIFYTDGVTERRRGVELFGVDRLRREAATLAGFPAEVVVARLRAAALGFSPEPPRDDIAIFAMRNDAAA
jgi:sigma-B regulation protein RsbU (phosphoserine phosphatase)